jgi:hypothetical protein
MAALDLNKLATTAVGAYLQQAEHSSNGAAGHLEKRGRRLGTGAAIAVGAGLAVAAQAAYRRVRELDLEEVGTAMENKLKS